MTRACASILLLSCSLAGAVDIRGRVLNPDGEPVSGADVWLSRERIVSTSATDDAGSFEFQNVTPGRLSLTARKPGFALTGLTGHVFDDLSVDLHLSFPDTVRLRVIDHAGAPVEGARVKHLVINDRFEVHASDLAQYGFPSIRSDADGAIAILGVPEGCHVTVTLEHRKFCDLVLPYLVPVPQQHPAQLYPGQQLRGRVTGPSGEGVPLARILLYQERDEGQRMLMYDVLSDLEGYYRTMVPPGSYVMEAQRVGNPTPKPQTVHLADGFEETIVDFLLPNAHTIEGRIIGPDDVPMPGVMVRYLIDDYTQDECFSNREGVFHLTVSSGSGRVRVIPPPGYMTADPLDVAVHLDEARHTRISAIALERLPVLRGRIVDASDSPQAAVLVRTLNLRVPRFALSDEDGEFSIPLDAMPDVTEIELRAEHTLRFLRRDFSLGLRAQEQETVIRLRQFEPDLRADDRQTAPNDLGRLAGKPAPELACSAWLNTEEPVLLEELKGNVVVLLLWAGFDPFGANAVALRELTLLNRALSTRVDDVVFLAVHDDSDPPSAVRNYCMELGVEFPVGVDASPLITHNRYDTRVLPQVVLIDKKGIVRYFDVEGRLPELVKDLRRRP